MAGPDLFRPDNVSSPNLQGYWKMDGAFGSGNADPSFAIGNAAGNAHAMGVAFTATSSYNVSRVLMRFKKNGTPTWTYRIRLYAADGSNLPTGSILAETANISVSTFTTSMVTYNYALSSPYALTEGENYVLAMEYVSGGTAPPDASHYIFSDGKIEADQPRMLAGATKSSSDVWAALPATWIMYFNIIGDEVDYSGNGNDLTNVNYSSSATQDYWGDSGSKYMYRPSGQYYTITDAAQTGLDMTGSWSACGWIRTASNASHQYIVSKGYAEYGLFWTYSDFGAIGVYLNGSLYYHITSPSAYANNKWLHVGCTYNSSNNKLAIYLNGNLEEVITTTTGPSSGSNAFVIGQRGDSQDYVDGWLFDVAVWDIQISSIQMKSIAMGVDLYSNSFRPDDVSTQPDAWWQLDEHKKVGTNTSRYDSVGSYTLSSPSNPTNPLTKHGYVDGAGADFNGSHYLTAANNTVLHPGNVDVSGACWFKTDGSLGVVRCLMSVWEPNGGHRSFLFYVSSSGLLNITVSSDGLNTTNTVAVSTTDLRDSTWYHCAFTYNATTDDLKVYLDGKLEATSSHANGFYSSSTATFTIGAYYSSGSPVGYCQGMMSDAALWIGTELTASEVQNLASAFPIQQEGVVSYWKLDETSGTRADSIGSNNLTDYNTVGSGVGIVNDAADFVEANSEYLGIADGSQTGLDLTREYTIIGLSNPDVSGAMWMFGKYNGTTGYALKNNTGSNKADYYVNGSVRVSTLSNYGAYGGWVPMAVVYDRAKITLYHWGAYDNSVSWTTDNTNTAHSFRIASTDTGTDFWDGKHDEYIIAERWFRPEEIKNVFIKNRLLGLEWTSDPVAGGSTGNFFLLF